MIRPSNYIVLVLTICFACISGGCKEEYEEPEVDLLWLSDELIEIGSVDPEEDDAALDAILQKIGDASIAGLGEGSHGTTEFWSIRQKITRYLVEKKGFSTILFEASLPGSFALHDYIASGLGNASEAHYKLGSWRYLEMQNLISWMRQYNIDHPDPGNGAALNFYGYDCAFSGWTEAINMIISYLQTVDPGETENIETRLLSHTREDAVYVNDLFVAKKSLYVTLSSEKEYSKIARVAANLLPSWEIWDRLSRDEPTLEYRDSVNIINVNWILENLPSGSKVVIWAHNAHIRHGYSPDAGWTEAKMLGYRLQKHYGTAYYSIATEFHEGWFNAWDVCQGHDFVFTPQEAALPPDDSYTHIFNETGIPLFFLDLSKINYADEGAAWIKNPRRMREIGALYCREDDLKYYYNISLPENYDGIVFVKTSHPTTKITL